ncbi:MAG TPA: EAL domain-containing protein [Trueperaceae bacterium]
MPVDNPHDDDPFIGLTFQYQPILGADGARLLAYETLVRRSRRDGTIDGPDVLLPVLTGPDWISAFTRLSLEFALARLDAEPYLPALSVNLSPRQMELDVVGEVISRAPVSIRRRLMIELTEDPIVDHPGVANMLHGLAVLGVRVFLDDVTLCSAMRLSTLRRAVHGLKLDRSLVGEFSATKLSDEARALIDMADDSGLLLVAEGIEDAKLLPRLAARGIPFFQGFALGEPWTEPKVARRRIVSPGNVALLPEPELLRSLSRPISKLN